MKKIKQVEEIIEKDYSQLFSPFYYSYLTTMETGNETLNIEMIEEDQIKRLLETCKEYGVGEITISSTWSGTVKVMWEFQKNGAEIKGMKEISSGIRDFKTKEYKLIPAFVITF